jgi:hypothetical protein
MSVISGPIAPESNPPIQPYFYLPGLFYITALSLGSTTTVTTNVNHNYVIGQEIRLLVPQSYGTRQVNNQTGFVIGIPAANQVVVTINSQNANAFIASPAFPGNTMPQIVPVGDINTGLISSTGRSLPTTTIPGTFETISPVSTTWSGQ